MGDRNIFNFRRLKWGDPERKFKLLSEDLHSNTDAGHGLGTTDYVLIAFTLISIAISVFVLLA